MNEEPSQEHPTTEQPSKKPSIGNIVASTLAAAAGIQKDSNRQRDFQHGNFKHFIISGVIFTILFIGLVITVVNLVLSDKGNTDTAPKTSPAAVVETVVSQPNHNVPDFSAMTDVKRKKQAFFQFINQWVHLENKKIMDDRQRLQQLLTNVDGLHNEDRQFIRKMAKQYRETVSDKRSDLNSEQLQLLLSSLFKKVDVIPASLALAQSANESAWGTSRFAIRAHNYFGQWCFSAGCGLVPKQRSAGKTHEVAKFKHPQQSVISYMRNLNRNNAYQQLRTIRASLRNNKKPISGVALAKGLEKYSERGEAYVEEIQSMIRFNKLSRYDN